MDKYDFATEYILQQCGSLHWWLLSKKWKRITAAHIARIVVDEAQSQLTMRAADRCQTCGALWDIADIVENGNHVCSVCGTRR